MLRRFRVRSSHDDRRTLPCDRRPAGAPVTDRAALYQRLPLVDTDQWWVDLAAGSVDGHVVELGAGTGRLTAAFFDAGAMVTAVENDPSMLGALRTHLGMRARVLDADVTDLPPGLRAGVVVVAASLLNELPDFEARRRLLHGAARACRPDGIVALHLLGPWWLSGLEGQVMGALTPAGGGPSVDVMISNEGFDAWQGRRRARLIYRFPDGTTMTDDLDAAVVSPGELRALLQDAGLVVHAAYGARPPERPAADDPAWHLLATPDPGVQRRQEHDIDAERVVQTPSDASA